MRIQQGYAEIADRLTGKVTARLNVFSCCHCHRKIHTETLNSHEYGICFNCDDGMGRGLRCNDPRCQECTPFMRKLDAMEARERLRNWV